MTRNVHSNNSLVKRFGILVKNKRQEMGISQLELARRVFDNPSERRYIRHLEHGVLNGLTFITAEKICRELNIQLDLNLAQDKSVSKQLTLF